MHYRIRIQGRLSPAWADWFGGLAIENDERSGEAVLDGWLPDKAALYGVLNQIQALNLTLIAVTPLSGASSDPADHSPVDPEQDSPLVE